MPCYINAVVSTHDLGDLIAAVLADEAQLLGPSPEAVFLCLHKLYDAALSVPASAFGGAKPITNGGYVTSSTRPGPPDAGGWTAPFVG